MQKNETQEIWKPIPVDGFSDAYEVSSFGRIRNSRNGQTLNAKTQVMLTHCHQTKKVERARIVALAFVPNPQGFNYVRTKDGNGMNCSPENLEWVKSKHTRKENGKVYSGLNLSPSKFLPKERLVALSLHLAGRGDRLTQEEIEALITNYEKAYNEDLAFLRRLLQV